MIKIALMGGMLDVPAQEISSSFASMRFAESIPDQWTTDIELPRTARNVSLLGAYGELDRGQLFGEKIPCFIATERHNDVGCLTVDRLTEDTITVTVYFGTMPTEILDTKIRDIIADDATTTVDMVQFSLDTTVRNVGKYLFYSSLQAVYNNAGMVVPPYDPLGLPLMPSINVNHLLSKIGNAIGYTMPYFTEQWWITAKELVGSRNVPAVNTYGVNLDGIHEDAIFSCSQDGVSIGTASDKITVKVDQNCTLKIRIGGKVFAPNPPMGAIRVTSDNAPYADGMITNDTTVHIIIDYSFSATAGTVYSWDVESTALYGYLSVRACTVGQTPQESDEHATIDPKLMGRYTEGSVDEEGYKAHNYAYPYICDCYIGTIACLGDVTVKELLTALCWQTGQRIVVDGNTLSFTLPNATKTLRNATLIAFEPVFDKLGRQNKIKHTDGDVWSFGINNSLLADEVTVQDVKIWSKRAVRGIEPLNSLYAPIFNFNYDDDTQKWEIEMGEDIDGVIIGVLNTSTWFLRPIGKPSWMGIDELGKVALTTWQTYEDVSEYDYVFIDGHKYMIVDGTTDEESGLCEFRALEVMNVSAVRGRDFSDDFSDDFS